MNICGIKLTHDASVAVIEDGKLVFCHELEKIANNPRYSTMEDFGDVEAILQTNGFHLKNMDHIVIDGWGNMDESVGDYYASIQYKGEELKIELAKYGHLVLHENILTPREGTITGTDIQYSSYMHVTGHLFSSYCTSPFPEKKESAYVLVWDGGMVPQLFYYDYDKKSVHNLKPVFWLNGNIYTAFAQQYPPFDKTNKYDLSVSGKVMAYIAMGNSTEEMLKDFQDIYDRESQTIANVSERLMRSLYDYGTEKGHRPEDMIATFHDFLERLLTESLAAAVSKHAMPVTNLCLSGGCALNIKWNNAIRESKVFKEVWVPPFPNDSGSSIGVACCEMIRRTGNSHLRWNVYSGPQITVGAEEEGWNKTRFTEKELAQLLFNTLEPVVVLQGNAELGPRALGNRSILAAPTSPSMKDLLNQFKNREHYRPVAPICMTEMAPVYFDPGNPDPFMLFDHKVREAWIDRLPAICHLDGTARLQTVSREENGFIYRLLEAFKQYSGVGVLCNTSANLNGSGFFPDVQSAMKWGRANFIYSDGFLFYKNSYEVFVTARHEMVKRIDNENEVIIDF